MPEHFTHYLDEDDTSGILQTFSTPTIEPPSPATLNKRFVFPLHPNPNHHSIVMASGGSQASNVRVAAAIERLPVEIFGMHIRPRLIVPGVL